MDFETFAGHELSELTRRLVDAAARQTDAATAKATAAFQSTLDKLREEHQNLITDNERVAAERTALAMEKSALVEAASRDDRGALLEQLLGVFERIDRGSSVDDVLGAAADGFTDDFSRVATLTVRDQHLVVSEQRGAVRLGPLSVQAGALGGSSWLAHATRLQIVRVFDKDTKSTGDTPFGGKPSVIVTAPITVRGDLAALIYADDEGTTQPSRGADSALRLAGIIQRHATLRLERLTLELKTIAELRAYAQMLLDEVEYVHAADATAKKKPEEQRDRLSDNLRCARQIFEQRVTLEGPAAATLLDEIVTKTLTAKAGTPFGSHLADAASRQAA